MKAQLAYNSNETVSVCRECYGHPTVEAETGAHGPVLDSRHQDECDHCFLRVWGKSPKREENYGLGYMQGRGAA